MAANIALNITGSVDIRMACLAFGQERGQASAIAPTAFNIGLTQMKVGKGEIPVVRGDDFLDNRAVDLLKIDVEGMEAQVLSGLTRTIKLHQPAIYVETSDQTREQVINSLAPSGYKILRESSAYGTQSNLTLVPSKRREV